MKLSTRSFLGKLSLSVGGIFVPSLWLPRKASAQGVVINGFLGGADPDVTAYVARVLANGGTALSGTQLTALTTLVRGLKSDSIWTSIKAMNCMFDAGLVTMATPLVVGNGSNPWSNSSFLSADLTANGLVGVPARSAFLNTGLLPLGLFSSDGNAGISIYTSTTNNTQGFELGRFSFAGPPSAFQVSINFSDTKTRFDCWDNATLGGETQATVNKAGFYSCNRVATNNVKIYFANSTNAFAQVASNTNALSGTGTRFNDASLLAMATATAGGSVLSPTDRRVSGFIFHDGLTSAQSQSLFNRYHQFRIDCGGGSV